MSLPLYAKCPRCRGSQMISVITDPGDGWRPSRGEFVPCPVCAGTGEADMDKITEMAADENEWREFQF